MTSYEGRTAESVKFRPYVHTDEFSTGYPIQYRPNEGIIDTDTGRNISLSLPTTSKFAGASVARESSRAGIHAGAKLTSAMGRKNIYSDLEFKEYFIWSNSKELIRSLFQSSMRNYARQLISQPFEVSRMLLQVGCFEFGTESAVAEDGNDDYEEDDEEEDFFEQTTGSPRGKRYSSIERSVPKLAKPITNVVSPLSLHTIDVMSSLISKEGFKGVFRCINTSFLYSTLFFTIDAWICGFLSPVLGVPDPFFIDIVHSTNPHMSLCLSVASSCITGLLLSPISLIRTKFIVTSTQSKQRSFKKLMGKLSWRQLFLPPVRLIIPTLNFELSSHFFKSWVPYILFTRCSIDRYTSPAIFATVDLITSIVELFVKLPLETLLRRSQVDYLVNDDSCPQALKVDTSELSVKLGGYHGYWSTLYYIYYGTKPVNHEDKFTLEVPTNDTNVGLEGCFRGWRVGLINVISSWALSIMNDQNLESYTEEKF